jgi:dienelactone hydrolase
VLAVEPLGFGDRRDLVHRFGKDGKPTPESGCQAAFALATMLGSSLARLRVNDLQRSLDYFQTVPQVDPKRIGLMGISGGGQMTLWTTAVEPRFKAAIVSGYINEFRHSVLGMYHCICNFVPGLATQLDMADLAALVAPRPLLIQSGTKDDIFPIKATKSAIKEIRSAYSVFGVKENVEVDIFEGEHQWSPTKVAAFLKRSL